jgi:hypothetical protein
MVGLTEESLDVMIRRFVCEPLTGADLAEIRNAICNRTQSSVAEQWGWSRNAVSAVECSESPEPQHQSMYLGLMFASLCQRKTARELLVMMRKTRQPSLTG